MDVLSFYLSGLTPSRVSSFGSLHLFKPSQKPKEAGNATRCLDCAYEKDCVWSAKKIYVEPLSNIEVHEHVSEYSKSHANIRSDPCGSVGKTRC